ncbi:hypothetical protein F3Y22_tig00110895pilonHSYRG00539 [Hibiscus syriacus]|uniref:BHLH domain-containing protein n=1 Tax=Hibiscus syriacus TaxID=106335 RepID=A0A6A2ZFK6_HIBSY|nr:hypothetical protein F3Y22_tig00110895pilonHSYRG00539 [Hibiscus syriacus]
MKDIQFKAQLHGEGVSQFHSEPISTSRRKILDSKQYKLGFELHDEGYSSQGSTSQRRGHPQFQLHDEGYRANSRLDFNFTTKDIQFKAQLHGKGASQFHSEPILTSRRRILDSKQYKLGFQLHDEGYSSQGSTSQRMGHPWIRLYKVGKSIGTFDSENGMIGTNEKVKREELGKLVPGGSKMNTAEMLQSAFKYVKYLQTQLGILQLMDSSFPKLRTEADSQLVKTEDDIKCNLDAFEFSNHALLDSYIVPYDPLISFTYENLSSYSCSKRQKLIKDQYCSDMMPGVFDGVALSRFPVLEDQRSMNQFNCNTISDETCVSVQSIAARERREGHEI